MRQVPRQTGETVPHLLVGNGRLARHLAHYLSLVGIPHKVWPHSRVLNEDFALRAARAERIWLLVSDSAIKSVGDNVRTVVRAHCETDCEPMLFHTSGAATIEGLRGVHPLMTFGPALYDRDTYRGVPFIIEDLADGASVDDVLGGLPNAATFLDREKRALYHALVSVSGNFPAILWAETFGRFERDLGLPRELLVPFVFRSLMNVVDRGEDALTGPLIRGDRETVRRHHDALSALRGGTALDSLYAAFERFLRENASDGEKGLDYEQ